MTSVFRQAWFPRQRRAIAPSVYVAPPAPTPAPIARPLPPTWLFARMPFARPAARLLPPAVATAIAGDVVTPPSRDPYVLLLVWPLYDPSQVATVGGLPAMFGAPVPFGDAGITFGTFGGTVTLYLSDIGYNSKPTDNPADTWFAPRLVDPYNIEVQLFPGAMPDGRAAGGFGAVRVLNNDGGLDPYLRFGVDGRDLSFYRVRKTAAFSTASLVAIATADGIGEWTERDVSLQLRDRRTLLDKPLLATYGGTGDLEGGSDLVGKSKPLLLGKRRNILPVLIDADYLIYQFHDGTAHAVDGARDKGSALTASGVDAADLAALRALTTGEVASGADIERGEYATCLALGLVRIAFKTDGQLTLDARGDATGGYVDQAADLARRVATTRNGVDNFADPAGLVTDDFDAVTAAQPAVQGHYFTGAETVGDALTQIMAKVGGWWNITAAGLLTVGILSDPASASTVATLTDAEISGVTPLSRRDPGRVAWKFFVGYQPNSTVQTPDQLAAGVTAADAQFYGEAIRYAEASSSAALTKHRLAEKRQVDGAFDAQADASAEATRLTALHGVLRDRYQVKLTDGLFVFELGQAVAVDVNRFDLPGGKNYVIVGKTENAAGNAATLELWG